ncbi:MAG: hypothetical protein V4702_01275 [Patescibacteria group bacterium]
MKACILYRSDSEFSRIVEEYARDFEHFKGKVIELIDLNTRDGAAMATLYDILHNPTLVVIRDDGQLVKDWQGEHLPLKDELAGYLV